MLVERAHAAIGTPESGVPPQEQIALNGHALQCRITTEDPQNGDRLLRYKTTRYVPHEQRAEIRFLYDKLSGNATVDRYVSDFDSHVYYPREVELLFRLTGFDVESRYGDYQMRPLRQRSRAMIFTGVKR